MKNVVVFGGGTGLSCLLSGLKLFPLNVTAVITMSDDGKSTGQLKKELDIPAVGDIGKVLMAMANVDNDFIDLLGYRFSKESFLQNHPIRNILLAALIDIKGDITEATKYMSNMLNINGTVLPLTEEKIDLIGYGKNKKKFFGETKVSKNIKEIDKLDYDHKIKINKDIINRITDADLIIFSPGSLYTSVIPHLLSNEVQKALDNSKAPLMYVMNLVTQPGETDKMSASDHIKVLNSYLKNRKIDVAIANNARIDKNTINNYIKKENKSIVRIDKKNIEKEKVNLIEDNIFTIDEFGAIRHDSLRTAYLIFSYLMEDIK